MAFSRVISIALLSCAMCAAAQDGAAQRSSATAGKAPQTEENPVLRQRPAGRADAKSASKRLSINVVVDDAAGKPITGLQPWDFKLFDNGQPRKITYFRAFDNAGVKTEPPAEVILVLDELNMPFSQVAMARDGITRFLEQNGGVLEHPVSLMLLTDAGLNVQPRPSLDGKALAGMLKNAHANMSSINRAMGFEGSQERFRRSIRQLQLLAENETRKPGRKLLIWVGAGWPMLESQHFVPGPRDKESYFQAIVSLSRWFREASIAVYSVSMPGEDTARESYFQSYLKPVTDPRHAQSGNLSLGVLAVETGGRVLGPNNDVTGQIEQCVADADAYYQLTFEIPQALRADEYHELRVQVNRPGAVVRTFAGYYDEPPADH